VTKISICDENFDLWRKFRFVTKISICDENFDLFNIISICDENFDFFKIISICDENFPQFSIFTRFWIFDMILITIVDFWRKSSISQQNFDFWPTFDLTKLSIFFIFEQNILTKISLRTIFGRKFQQKIFNKLKSNDSWNQKLTYNLYRLTNCRQLHFFFKVFL